MAKLQEKPPDTEILNVMQQKVLKKIYFIKKKEKKPLLSSTVETI